MSEGLIVPRIQYVIIKPRRKRVPFAWALALLTVFVAVGVVLLVRHYRESEFARKKQSKLSSVAKVCVGRFELSQNTVLREFQDAPLSAASSGLRPSEAIPSQTGEQKRQSDQ